MLRCWWASRQELGDLCWVVPPPVSLQRGNRERERDPGESSVHWRPQRSDLHFLWYPRGGVGRGRDVQVQDGRLPSRLRRFGLLRLVGTLRCHLRGMGGWGGGGTRRIMTSCFCPITAYVQQQQQQQQQSCQGGAEVREEQEVRMKLFCFLATSGPSLSPTRSRPISFRLRGAGRKWLLLETSLCFVLTSALLAEVTVSSFTSLQETGSGDCETGSVAGSPGR